MKNSSRKNTGKSSSARKPAKSSKAKSADLRTGTAEEEKLRAQEQKAKADAKRANSASGKEGGDDILYQVKTKRDSGVIKAYITFTYRVFHPQVTARMVLYGLLIAAPGFLVKMHALKIILWTIGGLVVLLGLFRQYISLMLTKRSDADHRNGTEFVYEFRQNDASFYRDGELVLFSSKYRDIDAVFYDEDYYYLRLTSKDFFVIPKDRFTIGDQATFGDFMYKRCKKVCHWIPAKLSNKIKKRRSLRALARKQQIR